MDRRSALTLLVVFGIGVFLAGLELMITAVALPSMLVDLVEPTGGSAWIELRKASWIINGYLLVYVVTMPLAGRLADLWGARRLFMGALTVFVVGSALAGASQNLDQLIAARLVQGVGGGVLVPVATAAASHLFEGHDRPRALGVIGALTFLGMAAGPFVGAAILGGVHVEGALVRLGLEGGTLAAALAPSWRWIFYVNVPIGIVAIVLAWAASAGWDTPRRPGRVDVIGASLFTIALASGLIGLTLLGSGDIAGIAADPAVISAVLFAIAAVATVLTILRDLRQETPFLEVRLFRSVSFSSAALVSLLTGYAFATAIIGGAVFVDRVLYGGPNDQRLALGALAGLTAVGALVSGFAVRLLSLRLVTLVGLVASAGALLAMSTWTASVEIEQVAARARDLRLWLRADGHAALHGGRGVGRAPVVRDRLGRRHGFAHDRHGDRPRHPDRVRIHDDRPVVRPAVRDAGGIPDRHPRGPPRPTAARPVRRGGARGLGIARGGGDHGRAVRRGGRGHHRGDPARPRARRPSPSPRS